MSTVQGAATYKKSSGMLVILEDRSPAVLQWTSVDSESTAPPISVTLDTVTKLQATPPTSDKMMLRIILTDETVMMFSFGNRIVLDTIKEALQHIVARYQSTPAQTSTEKPVAGSSAGSSAGSGVSGTSSNASLLNDKLLSNHELQQKMLLENKVLMKTFQEAVIKQGLPPTEFWITRIPMLRAYALATQQKKGPYNVLSTIKPVASSDNKVNVSVSRDKIHTIFQTYPIVRKAYDDNVPKNFKEQEFWQRFFSSKLFRKLRGEKIQHNDRGDVILDRYLTIDSGYETKDETNYFSVTKTIDLQANGYDDSQMLGNQPDFTMRPGTDANGHSDGVVDLLRGMNRLSEKMIQSLEQRPVYVAEEAQQLSDLEDDVPVDYREIHLKNIGVGHRSDTVQSAAVSLPEAQSTLKRKFDELVSNNVDLSSVTKDAPAIAGVQAKVLKSVKTNARQQKQSQHQHVNVLEGELMDTLKLTHLTSIEFLKHFWYNFNDGDSPAQTRKMYVSLEKSIGRVETVVNDIRDPNLRHVAEGYMKPVLVSLRAARERFDEAVAEAGDA